MIRSAYPFIIPHAFFFVCVKLTPRKMRLGLIRENNFGEIRDISFLSDPSEKSPSRPKNLAHQPTSSSLTVNSMAVTHTLLNPSPFDSSFAPSRRRMEGDDGGGTDGGGKRRLALAAVAVFDAMPLQVA